MKIQYVQDIVSFWKRQKRNWRIVVTRMVFNRFFSQLTIDYANIYVRALGASPVQLGEVNGIGALIRTLIATPIGWIQDRYSLRKLFTIGVGLLVIVSLCYAVAFDWKMIIPAILLEQFAMRQGSCVIICDVCLERKDRATGKALCEGIGSTPSLIAPILAAYLISFLGGITVSSIRFLYWIQFVTRLSLFFFIFIKLKEVVREKVYGETTSFVGSFREVFKHGVALKRWIVFSTVSMFTMNMMTPFRLPFAHEIKGAEQFIIGGMSIVGILCRIVFSTPLGRIADRVGRKKVFYGLIPMIITSQLLLVLATSSGVLILSAFFQGFDMISRIVVQASITPELVPIEYIGRWRGIINLFTGLASIPAPIIGGVIWERLGPSYVFLLPIVIDLLIRLPLLATIPETIRESPVESTRYL